MFRLFICRNQKNDRRAKNPQCVQRKKVFLISNFCVCKTWIKLWLVMLQNAFAYNQPPNLDFRLLQISFLFATCMNWKWYIVMIFETFSFFKNNFLLVNDTKCQLIRFQKILFFSFNQGVYKIIVFIFHWYKHDVLTKLISVI